MPWVGSVRLSDDGLEMGTLSRKLRYYEQNQYILGEGHFNQSKKRTKFFRKKGFLWIFTEFFLKKNDICLKMYEVFRE